MSEGEYRAEQIRRSHQAAKKAIEDAIASRIPSHYLRDDCTVVDFAPSLPFLILVGPTGTGKTTTAAGLLARTARARYMFPHFLRAPDVSAEASSFRFDHDELKAFVGRISRYVLLLVDDFGAEDQRAVSMGDSREFALSVWWSILEQRGTQDRLTIITTNVPVADWHKHFGGRIEARLHRHGKVLEL